VAARRSPLSRRRFLQLTGAGVAAAGAGPFQSASAQVGGPLQFISWQGYDLRGCMEKWEQANGVTLASTYIADYPDIPTKLGAGNPSAFDLTTYYNGFASLYINELKMITPLDRGKLPNWSKLAPFFQNGKWWVDGDTTWGVPWTFGVEGCNYLASEIQAPKSWMDLTRPEFKNRIAIVDDNIGIYYIGAQILGLGSKVPNLSFDELDSILELYRKFRQNARTIAYYGDLAQLFAAGEIVACIPGWGAVSVWSQQRGADVQMTIPSEGAFSFIEAYAIPKGSDNVDTAHAWINEAIGAEMQPCGATGLAGGVVNVDAVEGLRKSSPQVAALYDYDRLEELFAVAPVFDLPAAEGDGPKYSDWIAKWNAFKASP
jgi:spermidine/putrescine transport system substrate-binding protein